MATYSQDLTKGSVSGHLTRMTIPMFLGISSMILASMIDAIYIGIVGAAELAAISFTFPLIMALSSISMGIGTGAASLIARAQGAGERHRAQRFATHALMITMMLVLALMVAAYLYLAPIFSMMGAQPEILPLVVEYMSIWIFGLPLFTLPMVASNALRAVGNAKVPGYVMTTASAVQIVIAPLLIFGLLGLPELGFTGAAWASILSGMIRTLGMFSILVFGERLILPLSRMFMDFVVSTRAILYIGLPSMLNSLIGPVSMAIVIRLLSSHGPEVVAGFGITSRFEMLVMMILMSLSSSVGPFVGQNWGARKIDRIYAALKVCYRFCLAWGLACFILLAPFGDNLVALVNDETKLVESAGWYFALVPVTFGLLGIGMVSGSLFVALGRPLPTTVLSLLRMIVVYIPLAILFDHYWGYIGVFLATGVANVIMGGVAFYWSRRTLAREIKLLGQSGSISPGISVQA
ncbi:MAG: MATE family efflux transporter [Proteobacteria bacterium]|nr:MATE family efflux transporter [Pseudomonadota bacterium]